MNIIQDPNKSKLEMKKSVFYTELFYVENKVKVKELLNKIKKEHKGASHYCYAYIIGQEKYASDDGEPGGTAGMPILAVLEKEKLTNVLCVVIRYFGGTLLGAGGLVRAYTKSVTECLKTAKLHHIIPGVEITLIFSYDKMKKIDYLLKDGNILSKKFKEDVYYRVQIARNKWEEIEDIITSLCQKITLEKNCFL